MYVCVRVYEYMHICTISIIRSSLCPKRHLSHTSIGSQQVELDRENSPHNRTCLYWLVLMVQCVCVCVCVYVCVNISYELLQVSSCWCLVLVEWRKLSKLIRELCWVHTGVMMEQHFSHVSILHYCCFKYYCFVAHRW